MTQESAQEASPVWESHHHDDHPPRIDESFVRTWRETFYRFSPQSEYVRVTGTILAQYALEDGSCIHTGNRLLKEITGYYPQTVNKAVKRLLRERWLEQTHEATATTPRVFRLTIPEEFL